MTDNLEKELYEAGALDATGLIVRPALRDAWSRIAGPPARWSSRDGTRSADAFLRTILRLSRRWRVSFDDAARRMGY